LRFSIPACFPVGIGRAGETFVLLHRLKKRARNPETTVAATTQCWSPAASRTAMLSNEEIEPLSHQFIVPANENGMILDQHIDTDVAAAVASPFEFGHVFLFSHGWWTNAIRAMEGYNRFTIEFSRSFRAPPDVSGLPALNVGIHWPSALTEDEVSIANYFQALSFFTMEKRADAIGANAAFTLLRLILDAVTDNPRPLKIHLLGHSFGAKVVCSALQRLVGQAGDHPIPAGVTFDVVLLQAAFDNDELEPWNDYGRVAEMPGVRLLITRSDGDRVLSELYPKAHRLARLIGRTKPALGTAGPTDAAVAPLGGSHTLTIEPGFATPPGSLADRRCIVADLSPLHAANPTGAAGLSGHHSDIFYQEIYTLLAAFYDFN
jgi:hypothetical protein